MMVHFSYFFVCYLSFYLLLLSAQSTTNNEDSPCYKVNASECSYAGNFNCGVCECNDLHSGKHCECLQYSSETNISEEYCRTPGTTIECSGRGSCVCGVCECDIRESPNEVIVGRWCECDNFSCDHLNGKICGGKEHGYCECGKCICSHPWAGTACEFDTASHNRPPYV